MIFHPQNTSLESKNIDFLNLDSTKEKVKVKNIKKFRKKYSQFAIQVFNIDEPNNALPIDQIEFSVYTKEKAFVFLEKGKKYKVNFANEKGEVFFTYSLSL